MLRSVPGTTATGTSGRYRMTTPQSSVAARSANAGSATASSCAWRITDSRKPCGVWQRRSVSRCGIPVIRPSSTTTIVSEVGTATPTAWYVSSARTQPAMVAWSSSGRAASWNSTLPSAGPSAAIARRVDSGRVFPPSMIPRHLAVPAQGQQLASVGGMPGGHHHQGGVHPGSLLERGHRVLQQGPPGQREELFGERGAEAHPQLAASTTATVRMSGLYLDPPAVELGMVCPAISG